MDQIRAIPTNSTPDDSSASESRGLTITLLVALAVGCWGAAWLLTPSFPPIHLDSVWVWFYFGRVALCEALQAIGILALGVVGAMLFPRIGLVVEGCVLRSRLTRYLAVLVIVAVLSSGLFAYFVFDHMPHLPDDIIMEFQAKILAMGRLYAPAPAMPEFFDVEFALVDGPKWYGKYFLFQSLLLVPGIWAGMVWAVHPLLAGVAVLLVYAIGRELLNEKIARVAAMLMVLSPIRLTMFSMTMSHASCMVLLLLFALAVIKVVKDARRIGWGFIAGLSLGMAFNSRPLTTMAMGGTIALCALPAMPWRKLRWGTPIAALFAFAIMLTVFWAYNAALTGDPRLTPFAKWSPSDHPGFGPDVGIEYWNPRDRGHTPAKALYMNAFLNAELVGSNLTGWGYASLALLAGAVVFSRRRLQAWVLALPALALVCSYAMYYVHGSFAGQPRYWSEAIPALLLLVALGLAVIRRIMPGVCRSLGTAHPARTARSACWLALLLLVCWSVPRTYKPLIADCWVIGHEFQARDSAERQELTNALVFVHSGHYRTQFLGKDWDRYLGTFMLNSPLLDGPVVYARDLGDEKNRHLAAAFPERTCYKVTPQPHVPMIFEPYDIVREAATRSHPD